ncbi:unnamed protein product, partial [marine sediment metagenome]
MPDIDKLEYVGNMIIKESGQSIVPEYWVKESTRQWMYAYGMYGPTYYGYQWWIKEVDGCFSYRAWGRRGQFVVVIPELDMVIVVTSATALPHPPTSIHYSPLFDLVASSVKRERPPKKPLKAVELPDDVKAFITGFNQAIFDLDRMKIANFISDLFLYDGVTKQRYINYLWGTISYVREAKIVLTKFEPEGGIAKIESIAKDKYFKTPYLTGNMIIKESGQWKW